MNWYKISQKYGLNVKVLSYTSDGNLAITINGKLYRYNNLPTNPEEIVSKIEFYNRKGWGKRVKDIIDYLDKYREQI